MKKNFLFFGLFIITMFVFQKALAQLSTEGVSEDQSNTFLPSAPGSTDLGTEENIYLQNAKPKTEETTKTAAQSANGKLSGIYEGTKLACPYAFERDLQVGSNGEDVRLLQIILNGDKRTLIAISGPGSLGKETNTFGEGTKVALKKFQALFIEYVGVANGRFGPRTRTVVNAICNGDTTNKQNVTYNNVESVQKNATPQGEVTEVPNDKIAPRVSLSANLNTVEVGNSFKVVANFSEEVKPITPDSIIVDGGDVKEIRKLSKTSYSITITLKDGSKAVVVQVEADKVEDLAGNKNENASNEITVKVKPAGSSTSSTDPAGLDGLVNKVVSSAPSCNYDNQGQLVTINPNTGAQINATGCPTQKTAAYNSQLGCYADSGPLPSGVSEERRCSNPNNPNNPNSPCSAQNQSVYRQQLINYQQQMQQQSYYGYGYGYISQPPQNPCQNAQIANATQNSAQQGLQNAAQAQQQAAQNSALGQMLGNLLGKNMMGSGQGGGQNGSGGNGGGGNGGGGGSNGGGQGGGQTGPTSAEAQYQAKCKGKPVDDKECQELAVKANDEQIKKFCATEEGKKSPDCANNLCTSVECLNKDINKDITCDSIKDEVGKKKCEEQKNTETQAGQVSEDPKATAKECPYLFYPEKKTYKSLKGAILEINSTPGNKKYIYFTENPWDNYQDVKKDEYFIKKNPNIISQEKGAICCKSTTRVKGAVWSSSAEYSCTIPSSKKDLPVYKINTNKKDDVRFQTDKPVTN